ncbi:response regulator [Sphingosinicella sp. CPCC 101087]|uniref:response regulator n=1 Tax=Sphingosinicella sp. CPCC 101087 TaxID=2497754 RepID=UPI00197DB8A5|nr:response regulator [Sphingosinicella sp. CPCC 101087]
MEDEELVALALVDELTRLGWSVVGPATTLEQAQDLVSSGVHLDAAILDINLQGRWAHGIAEELSRRGVPFVACTGYEMVDPDGRFADAPLIVKPIAADRLSATLDELLDRSEPQQTPMEPSAG